MKRREKENNLRQKSGADRLIGIGGSLLVLEIKRHLGKYPQLGGGCGDENVVREKSHHSFSASPSRLYYQIFKIYECNTRCLASSGLDSSVAWVPLWFSGSALSFPSPAKISKAFAALAAWVCDWSNSHSWPSKPHSLFQIWELEQPWLKLPPLRFSPLWLLFQSTFPSSRLPLAPHKWGCIFSLLKDGYRIPVSNLLFLLTSFSVVPLLPQSSSPVKRITVNWPRPRLQSHRFSHVSDPTQLQSPTGARSLTSVSPSHRHQHCPGSPHPPEIWFPPHPSPHLPSCSPEKPSIFYKFTHRNLLCLAHLPSPHHPSQCPEHEEELSK